MQIEQIALDKLIAHPANANVMDETLLSKLQTQIQRSGRYEPLLVRKHPTQPDGYELINGHHRKKVLERLEDTEAHCIVWPLSDDEALLLLAGINRLHGRDDPVKRAKLLEQLQKNIGDNKLLNAIPETRERLGRLLTINRPEPPVNPQTLKPPPQAVTFFLTKPQRQIVNAALKQIGQQNNINQRAEQITEMAKLVMDYSYPSPARQ